MATQVRSLPRHADGPRFPRIAGPLSPGALAALALAGIALAGWLQPGPSPSSAAPSPSFVSRASGLVERPTALRAAPGGGVTVELLPAGARLEVAGRVPLPAGLREREALWVSASGEGGEVYGFLPAEAVRLLAGDPPSLDLRGIDRALLLAPPSGVRRSAALGGARDDADATGAGSPDALAYSDAGDASLAAREATALSGAAVAAAGAAPIDASGAASGAASGVASGAAPAEGISIAWLPDTVRHWIPQLEEAGRSHGVDPELLAILMIVESGGHPTIRSHAGATGLMQVMPTTGQGIAQERGIAGYTPAWLEDPATCIDFGAYYIAQQLRAFGSADDPDWRRSVSLAAAAYNGGPGRVQQHLRGAALPAESQLYQDLVGGMWAERDLSSSPTFERWLGAGGRVMLRNAAAAIGL